MSKFLNYSSASLPLLAAVLVLTLSAGYFTLAWTEPSGTMPVSVSAPLNTGSTVQGRMGALGIGTTTPAVGFKLDVNGKIQEQGSDFILGTNDGRAIGSKTGQRALVHFDSDTLHLNYEGDYEGGTVIGGPTTTVSGSFCIGSTCVSTSTWETMVNNYSIGIGNSLTFTVPCSGSSGSTIYDFSYNPLTNVMMMATGADYQHWYSLSIAPQGSKNVLVGIHKQEINPGNNNYYLVSAVNIKGANYTAINVSPDIYLGNRSITSLGGCASSAPDNKLRLIDSGRICSALGSGYVWLRTDGAYIFVGYDDGLNGTYTVDKVAKFSVPDGALISITSYSSFTETINGVKMFDVSMSNLPLGKILYTISTSNWPSSLYFIPK